MIRIQSAALQVDSIVSADTAPETAQDRVARLKRTLPASAKRQESLDLAHAAGVSDKTFATLIDANRLARRSVIVLPAHRFELLSRGKGWARKGRGTSVEWGDRADGGYSVGAGRWTVGGNDGFRRKGENTWTVSHVSVGVETWTVAS